ncbi:MAG: nucleoside deaminase [Clostridia bacterium]|nr:nucleoside deaminase [Clostridia bacterium]
MREAISLAAKAEALDEVPVGAVVVHKGALIVGRGYNARETKKNALCHAEIMAIDEACRTLGGWRLPECELFVTLEPCPMCAGAVINARISRVVYGAKDLRAGAFGTLVSLNDLPLNHKAEIVGGVLGDECAEMLRAYFKKKRK